MTFRKLKTLRKLKKLSKRNIKKMKGGTVVLDPRTRPGEYGFIIGTNPTGRADANLLNFLGVKATLVHGRINLPNFYKYPEKVVPGFNISFSNAYLGLSPANQIIAKRYIKYIAIERMFDARSHRRLGHPLDPKHAYIYALTRNLENHVIILDNLLGNMEMSKEQTERNIEIYKAEFALLLEGPVEDIDPENMRATAPYGRWVDPTEPLEDGEIDETN